MKNNNEEVFLAHGVDIYEFEGKDYASYTTSDKDDTCPGFGIELYSFKCSAARKIQPDQFSFELMLEVPENWTGRISYHGSYIEILVSNIDYVEVRRMSGFLDDVIKLLTFTKRYLKGNLHAIYSDMINKEWLSCCDD